MRHPILQWVHTHSVAIVAVLALIMMGLMFFSSAGSPFGGSNVGDSAIVDEVAHIPSAYSYLRYGDYRLNPEHPPLIKDIAGLPLLFLDLNFPTDSPAWTEAVNGQWDSGFEFLYYSGNNPDQILLWSRLPIMLLGIALLVASYVFARFLGGRTAGVIAAFVIALSPTIIAHARYVTTDVGMALFAVLSLYSYTVFLRHPSVRRLVVAGVILGLTLLAKFSSVVVVVTMALWALLSIVVARRNDAALFRFARVRLPLLRRALAVGVPLVLIYSIALFVVGVVYLLHVAWMPSDVQVRLIEGSLNNLDGIEVFLVRMAESPFVVVRAYAQYFLGVAMVFLRSVGGNTTFFLGEVNNQGWWYYFPIAFLLKIPLSIHVLWILGLASGLRLALRRRSAGVRLSTEYWQRFSRYVERHPGEVLILLFLLAYAYFSVTSSLNIGIRHLLPMLPLLIILSSKRIASLLSVQHMQPLRLLVVGALMLWLVAVHVMIYPFYLTYYNELIGHPRNGYRYITDSNFAWGQDLRRLVRYMDDHGIDVVYLDYFGGGVPEYYIPGRFERITASSTLSSGGAWVAVDAQQYSLSLGDGDGYSSLFDRGELRAQIGNSIFLFYIE